MPSKIQSAGILGIDAFLVDVEADVKSESLPSWSTVGLATTEVRESKDRVVAAIRNSGFEVALRKVTINLAPADINKEGTAFDLPIALAILFSVGACSAPEWIGDALIIGELGLDGTLRPVRGALSMAVLAREKKISRVILPIENAEEASVVQDINVYGLRNLNEVVDFLNGLFTPEKFTQKIHLEGDAKKSADGDLSDIRGQFQAKRALEIAAAGAHNILLSGPPGTGKTMLASRIPGILPELHFEESLETSRIYSVMGLLKGNHGLLLDRPFRAPHHSVSYSGLIGGGSTPRPGEVSLAHNGVLFLDELTEFQKSVLELLRQPLEDHQVTIARAKLSLTYPARFILVASCNPCPCGYLGHPRIPCRCTPQQIQKYRSKLSGPLLDRIDLQVSVPPVSFDDLSSPRLKCENSKAVALRVAEARDKQRKRFHKHRIKLNSQMGSREIESYCTIDEIGKKILRSATEKYHLSARAVSRTLKVARTIADMSDKESIEVDHLLEAIQYRNLDNMHLGG